MNMRLILPAAMVWAAAAFAQPQTYMKIIKECDLDSEPYRSFPGTVSSCSERCLKDPQCAAFTVSAKPGDGAELTCDLKRRVGDLVQNERGYTSGIKQRSERETTAVTALGPNDRHPVPPAGEVKTRILLREGIPPEEEEQLRKHFAQIVARGGTVAIGTPAPNGDVERTAPNAGSENAAPLRPIPAVTKPADPVPAGVAGRWALEEDPKQVIEVTQTGEQVTFRDRDGQTETGKMTNGKLAVSAWQAEASLAADGKKLQWSNGQVWKRVE